MIQYLQGPQTDRDRVSDGQPPYSGLWLWVHPWPAGGDRAVVGDELRPGNIWENVELPRLKNNPNVTRIIIIDPKTKISKIIFER